MLVCVIGLFDRTKNLSWNTNTLRMCSSKNLTFLVHTLSIVWVRYTLWNSYTCFLVPKLCLACRILLHFLLRERERVLKFGGCIAIVRENLRDEKLERGGGGVGERRERGMHISFASLHASKGGDGEFFYWKLENKKLASMFSLLFFPFYDNW